MREYSSYNVLELVKKYKELAAARQKKIAEKGPGYGNSVTATNRKTVIWVLKPEVQDLEPIPASRF